MLNNYPIKEKKQYKRQKLTYKDYIMTSSNMSLHDINDDISDSVNDELRGGIEKMRTNFKKNTKRLLGLYNDKKRERNKYVDAN